MAYAITSPELVVNLALDKIGYPQRVNDLRDGSFASQVAIDVYGQTRDSVIENGQWEFADRTLSATLLKSAPAGGYNPRTPWTTAFPALPWRYEYAYPNDCVKFRAVKPQPLGIINMNPMFHRYSLDNDNTFTPPQRVILCDVADAVLCYAGRVTDPLTWDASFTDALVDALVEAMGPKLRQGVGGASAWQMEQATRKIAERNIK